MELSEKLDRIIDLLERIEAKLPEVPVVHPVASPAKVSPSRKPTPLQEKNKLAVEFVNHHDSKQYYKAIKKHIEEIIRLQTQNPGWYPPFVPQSLAWFDTKFKKYNGTPFYAELKQHTIAFAQAVTIKGKALIDKLKGDMG